MAPVGVEGKKTKHPRNTENVIVFIKMLTDFQKLVLDIHRTHVCYDCKRKTEDWQVGDVQRRMHTFLENIEEGNKWEKRQTEWKESKEKEERIVL